MEMNLSGLGVYIALAFSALIGVYAMIVTKRSDLNTTKSYFTAFGFLDRKRIFFSVFATTFSAFTVVGLPAMFFAHGIGTFWFMWLGILFTPFTLYFVGKKIIELSIESPDNFASPIGLLTNSYKSNLLTFLLSSITIIVLIPYLILQIAGIGKFLVSISDGGISYAAGLLFTCIVVGGYVFTGGAKADAETDLIQGIVLVVGTVLVGIFLFFAIYPDYDVIYTTLEKKELLTMPGPKGYFSPSVILSYAIIFTLISISTPQVSQKLMGVSDIDDLKPLLKWYVPISTIVILLAGVIGLYAAAKVTISSPDFVTGDVLRDLSTSFGGISAALFLIVGILFIGAIVSAAISTIDSLLLAVSGIVVDNFKLSETTTKPKIKLFTVSILLIGLIFSFSPPIFIVDLAKIQLAGLTALVPCLLGPLFGFSNSRSGWLALILGVLPIVINYFINISIFNLEIGVIGLLMGIIGLFIGKIISNNAANNASTPLS